MPLFDSVLCFVQSTAERKVKQATDEHHTTGAMGTLMHEICILTYNNRTLRDITQVLKLRLTNHSKRASHKESIHILKSLTLILYLIINGCDEFLAWVRSNMCVCERLRNFKAQEASDLPLANQIRAISGHICDHIGDDELLEQRRREVVEFRSSISSPGRKSADNSHLRELRDLRGSSERGRMSSPWSTNAGLTAAHENYATSPSNGFLEQTASLRLGKQTEVASGV
ncbi:related to Epsin-4 [Zygosaccharomyces bailii]|nr:related to Epsin-4 [Zygosaccharomyces bailii]